MSIPRTKAGGNSALNAGAWLTPLTGHWLDAARAHLSAHAAVVRVTVVAQRGSAPREPGASMLVDSRGTVGTIGGGQLEWHATRAARELLRARNTVPVRIDDLILGPQLGQCCGGRVELWLERLTRDDLPWLHRMARQLRIRSAGGTRTGSGAGSGAGSGGIAIATEFSGGIVSHRLLHSEFAAARVELRRTEDGVTLVEMPSPQRPRLWIFGAGHVGQALVRLLSELALFDIAWIDSRPEMLPGDLPECVTTHVCVRPTELIAAAPPGTRYVVLTHDHGLDYELCRLILLRGDAAWLGLIGSASKAARFRSRLLRTGLSAALLTGLTCPIGIPGIASKLPAAIAIAIAAQLLQKPDAHPAAVSAGAPAQSVSSPDRSASSPAQAAIAPAQISLHEPQPCGAACGSCGSARRTEA